MSGWAEGSWEPCAKIPYTIKILPFLIFHRILEFEMNYYHLLVLITTENAATSYATQHDAPKIGQKVGSGVS